NRPPTPQPMSSTGDNNEPSTLPTICSVPPNTPVNPPVVMRLPRASIASPDHCNSLTTVVIERPLAVGPTNCAASNLRCSSFIDTGLDPLAPSRSPRMPPMTASAVSALIWARSMSVACTVLVASAEGGSASVTDTGEPGRNTGKVTRLLTGKMPSTLSTGYRCTDVKSLSTHALEREKKDSSSEELR